MMIKNLKRLFFISAALGATFIQGCGCDDDNDKYYPPPQQNIQMSGAASKGILINFEVNAYPIVDGEVSDTSIASDTTDANGAYTLEFSNDYDGDPLFISVTPAETGSVMRCDMESCGNGIAFGSDVPIAGDSNFSLSVFVPNVADDATANITIFTDIAAGLVMGELDGAADDDAVRAAIAEANSRVANRFGLMGNILTLPVIDLTNAAAVRAAVEAGNASYVQYAAINASIVAAVLSDNPNISLADALSNFVNAYVTNGLAGNTSSEAATGWNEILAYARSLLGVVANRDLANPINLAAIIQAVTAEEQLANLEQPDNFNQGTPSDKVGQQALAKVQAMVADLRNLIASVSEDPATGQTNIRLASEDFAMQVEAASLLTGEQTGYLVDAMAMAAAAIDDAHRVYMADNDIESYTSDTGVTVAIAMEQGNPAYSVEQNIAVETETTPMMVAVTLDAINSVAMEQSQEPLEEEVTVNGGYEFTGKAATSMLTLEVSDGVFTVTSLTSSVVSDLEENVITENRMVEAVDFHMTIDLAPTSGQGGVAISGTLMLNLLDVHEENEEAINSLEERTSFGQVSLQFSGEVSSGTEESVMFSISATGDGTGVSFTDAWTPTSETSTGETANNYVDFVGTLLFTADLTGIPTPVIVSFDVERTGLDASNQAATIRYAGKNFRFAMAMENEEIDGALTVANQDGVVMTLTENAEGEWNGTISLGGVQYAAVEDGMVNYTDPTIEDVTLF